MTAAEFWQFSLALYGRPEIAQECLDLQDQWGANVNLLLWLVWCEQRGRRVDAPTLMRAEAAIDEWNNTIVGPLRHLRRTLRQQFLTHDEKSGTTLPSVVLPHPVDDEFLAPTYQQLKHVELLAEQREQWILAQVSTDLPSLETLPAKANVRLYLHRLGVPDQRQQVFLRQL